MFPSRSTSDDVAQELRELPVELVVPNPSQPRRHFDEEGLQELAISMGEHGVLQPVLVRPLQDGCYELVAGERRWRAAKLVGLETIPALVRTREDAEALAAALVENMARQDLNPVEEARALAELVENFGLNYARVGLITGLGQPKVAKRMLLLKLSEEILGFLERGELSRGHGRALLRAQDPEVRAALAHKAVKKGWSVRELEVHAERSNDAAGAPKSTHMERKSNLEEEAFSVAKAWGDVLGTEVRVGVLPRGQMRLEVVFGSAERGIAMADRLSAAIAQGSKG